MTKKIKKTTNYFNKNQKATKHFGKNKKQGKILLKNQKTAKIFDKNQKTNNFEKIKKRKISPKNGIFDQKLKKTMNYFNKNQQTTKNFTKIKKLIKIMTKKQNSQNILRQTKMH